MYLKESLIELNNVVDNLILKKQEEFINEVIKMQLKNKLYEIYFNSYLDEQRSHSDLQLYYDIWKKIENL